MNLASIGISPARLTASLPVQRGFVGATELIAACHAARQQGASLAAIYGSDERDRERGFVLRVVLRDADGLTVLDHALGDATWQCPDLTPFFPAAARMQRAVRDLLGIEWDGSDQRPWLRHAAWADDRFPLRRDFLAATSTAAGIDDYPFVRVEGEGVHEIAVGPVHAGIIEPGHFRFQVVGEKVLRLEERLGYVHKGIEKRFETLGLSQAPRLAARVSGDSTVAFSWAFADAVEALAGCTIPPRAVALRALLLERERIANHLGDLGYLGNDGGFAFGFAQFSRMKEDVLRDNLLAFGHRFAMDLVVPGGVACDLGPEIGATLRERGRALAADIARMREIYDEHAGLQDRFRGCGIVTPAQAARLGLCGLAGRASGRTEDLRRDFAPPPYDRLEVAVPTSDAGDVAARVALRFDELAVSIRLCDELVATLPEGDAMARCPPPLPYALSIGYVEGWRGPVMVALECGPDGAIRRCHPHDVSWQNWPVLEHAVIGNIVPDFPLINKSFNLTYSGHDL